MRRTIAVTLRCSMQLKRMRSSVVQYLIEQGADVNIKNDDNATALNMAYGREAYGRKVTDYLIGQGAHVNVEARDSSGRTPLHATLFFHFSAAEAMYLIRRGADVNATDDRGRTPLHLAAEEDSVAASAFFVRNGANLNAQNNDGETPLHVAVSNYATSVGEFLLRSGANINVRNNRGQTPLHIAKDRGGEIAAYLLRGKN